VSPSLRTYGTFGSIQSSLTKENDSLTLAVSAKEPEQSDIFVPASTPSTSQVLEAAAMDILATDGYNMMEESTHNQGLSPGSTENRFWGDWNGLALMDTWDASFPLGWADHNLGFDPEHDWSSGFL
jgi:hypothetical protein